MGLIAWSDLAKNMMTACVEYHQWPWPIEPGFMPMPDGIEPSIPTGPNDVPVQSPQPQLAGTGWQCPGCGRIYAWWVSSCDCQMGRGGTTGNMKNIIIYP